MYKKGTAMQDNNEKTKEEILSQFDFKDGKHVHELKEAIVFGSENITEFILDKPKAKHIRKMPTEPSMDAILKVIGALANQPDKVIDELCLDDMNILAEYFSAFS